MKMMSELASGAAARTALYAKGATEEQAMAFLQPIQFHTHPLNRGRITPDPAQHFRSGRTDAAYL